MSVFWLKSLARRSDLMFSRWEGSVTDHGDFISIKTPSNPGYHWGNYLIFAHPPKPEDAERWPDIFSREFDYYDPVRHMVFAWEGGEPDQKVLKNFTALGFEYDTAVVLTANRIQDPPRYRHDLQIRQLISEDDWERAIANQIACRDPRFDHFGYEQFKRRQFKTYREMAAAGQGAWFGAFDGEHLAGELGIFHDGEIGRFQNVGTVPAFRRQGVCGTLVSTSARRALKDWGLSKLVMEADPDYHAARIYESVGFRPVETNHSLSWYTGDA